MWQQVSITQAVPVLEVTDVAASMAWYHEVLGFIADPFPQSPPFEFAILRHGGTEIMLRRETPRLRPGPRPYRWDVYLRLAGGRLREVYAELSRRQLVTRRLERMFYGLAEFEVTDPDGYVLCLSEEFVDNGDLPAPEV